MITMAVDANAGIGQVIGSIIWIFQGIAMVVIGMLNMEPSDCKTGASQFLFYGGIVLLVLNAVILAEESVWQLALKDGIILAPEMFHLYLLDFFTGFLEMIYLIIFVWGSVVVFSSASDWTSKDDTSMNYCNDLPMIFALGILIGSWGCLLLCCAFICIACCVEATKDIGSTYAASANQTGEVHQVQQERESQV